VGEAADLWIALAEKKSLKNDLATSTVRQYRTHAEQHIKKFIAGPN